MKPFHLAVIIVSLFLFNSIKVDAKNFSSHCPEKIEIEVLNIAQVPLSEQIKASAFLLQAFDLLKNIASVRKTFLIHARTATTLCVYGDRRQSALLQVNNKNLELLVGLSQHSYLRIPLRGFTKKYLEVKNINSLRTVLAGDFGIDSDGGTVFKQEAVIGWAASVNLKIP